MQHDASEQPHKQMQNKNHWKKPKNGGGKGKSLKIGGDWNPESLSTLDADLSIVQKAIESASSMDTVLIGDDTDLLVLLLHHLPQYGNSLR